MSSVHVAIVPETVFHIGSFPVTNSLLTAWVTMAVIIVFAILFSRNIKAVPGKIQAALEYVIDSLLSFLETVSGDRKIAERFFPIVATIFLYILLSNWAGILPGVGSIGIKEVEEGTTKLVPLFRSTFSDLNMTMALALIAVVLSHYFGLKTVGFKEHIGKFVNFKGPVDAFAGALEIVGEISKIISLSFRLFGNIFAGEVLLTIIAFLVPFIAPLPFLGLELFVGLIQALIFATLAMVAFSSFTRAHSH
ncbi:MAG: F0F1 ATP synthase subunit A [Candidatus Taylorbacteria bacterium]|nr:F0F1 ATP synthase subunit A [Candidatus Taylorbacteria bacterium]